MTYQVLKDAALGEELYKDQHTSMTMHADTFRMSFMFFEQSLKETIHLSFSLLFRLSNNEGRCHDVNLYSLVLSGILHVFVLVAC